MLKSLRWLTVCMLLAGAPVYAQSYELNIDEWIRPRSGERVVQFSALQEAVHAWSQAVPGSIIEIRYPGGEEGSLWAQELIDWLVAFGVPSESVRPAPGSARRDRISLVVIEARE